MKRRIAVASGNRRPDSVFGRMRALDEAGYSRDEIRERLIGDGAKPETVDTYLQDHLADSEEMRREAGARACDKHLADLWREHGPQQSTLGA